MDAHRIADHRGVRSSRYEPHGDSPHEQKHKADGVGFEPTSRFRDCRFSRPVHSTALPPILNAACLREVYPWLPHPSNAAHHAGGFDAPGRFF